jgi:calcium-dependent protein kinase
MLSHPHIVKLIQYYDDEDFQYLVFELCQGPDLLDHIHNQPNRRMDEYAATVALRHMLKALQCCHASHRGHFDIKPENFMYSDVECTNLKMIDLGLSSGFHRKSKEVSALQGTAEYMAPEFWDGIYGPEGDVWSCGVVLFVMLTGENFLSDKIPLEKLPREIKVRKALACRLTEAARTYGYGHSTQDLLGSMLLHDRHARVTVRGCLRHALITGTYVTERENVSYSERPLIKKAHNIFRNIPSIFRAFAKEPMLKKVARLAFAHAGPTCLAEQYVFQMLDIHGYGEISIGVLEDDLERAGVPIPDDIEELFEAVDLNRDGYIGSLAFVSATLPASSLNDEALCRNVFSMFNKAKDGFLTASDLEDVFCHDEGSPICKDVLAEVCEEGEERLSLEQFTQMMGTEEFAVCGSAVAAVRKGLPWERSDGQKALKSELGA